MSKNVFAKQRQIQAAGPPAVMENPYSRLYRLRENPFPSLALFVSSTSDPRTNGEIYDEEFRRDEEKRFFDRFVLPPTGDKPLPIGFLRLDPQAGGRGNGKSTFLHHVMVRVNTTSWRDWPRDQDDPRLCAAAIHLLPEPRQQNSFFELVRLLFNTLYRTEISAPPTRRRLVQKIDGEIRAALLLDVLPEEKAEELSKRPAEDITADLESAERFAALLKGFGIDIRALAEAARKRLQTISSTALDNDFVNAFLENGISIEAVWAAWLQNGWATSDYRWKRLGAKWLTDGLVPVLMLAGYRRLFVLLDEFEKIYIYQTGRKREEFLDLLRQVFYEQDSAAVRTQYITTVLSIHPSIETYLKNPWARVGLHQLAPLAPDEIKRISVELGKSTPERLAQLLITYLDYFRSDDDPERGKIYPFAPGALAPAMLKARFYPRDTLRYAHAILRKAASEGIPAPIDVTYVERFLSSGQAPPEEEEDEISALATSETKLTED
jgi:hypothetical protein